MNAPFTPPRDAEPLRRPALSAIVVATFVLARCSASIALGAGGVAACWHERFGWAVLYFALALLAAPSRKDLFG